MPYGVKALLPLVAILIVVKEVHTMAMTTKKRPGSACSIIHTHSLRGLKISNDHTHAYIVWVVWIYNMNIPNSTQKAWERKSRRGADVHGVFVANV